MTRGWLAPLLSDMAADRTRVMLPVIDDVDEETFEYVPTENDHVRGGIDRKLMHRDQLNKNRSSRKTDSQ